MAKRPKNDPPPPEFEAPPPDVGEEDPTSTMDLKQMRAPRSGPKEWAARVRVQVAILRARFGMTYHRLKEKRLHYLLPVAGLAVVAGAAWFVMGDRAPEPQALTRRFPPRQAPRLPAAQAPEPVTPPAEAVAQVPDPVQAPAAVEAPPPAVEAVAPPPVVEAPPPAPPKPVVKSVVKKAPVKAASKTKSTKKKAVAKSSAKKKTAVTKKKASRTPASTKAKKAASKTKRRSGG